MSELCPVRVIITTQDYTGSLSFYGDRLGFDKWWSWDHDDGRGTMFNLPGGGQLEVVEESEYHPHHQPVGVRLGVECEDVKSLYERLSADLSVEIEQEVRDEPWGHRSFAVRDPQGLTLTFYQLLDTHQEPRSVR